MSKIAYRPQRDSGSSHYSTHVAWIRGLPFFNNPRGMLVHRVRDAISFWRNGEFTHTSAHYWCGNNGLRGEFVDAPPEDKMLCERCERIAVANGEKPADELAGRHVHIGRVRPFRVCCTNEDN